MPLKWYEYFFLERVDGVVFGKNYHKLEESPLRFPALLRPSSSDKGDPVTFFRIEATDRTIYEGLIEGHVEDPDVDDRVEAHLYSWRKVRYYRDWHNNKPPETSRVIKAITKL